MTDSCLIVTDRTALETRKPGRRGRRLITVLREFVVLGDAQLLVPCPRWGTSHPHFDGDPTRWCLDEETHGRQPGPGLVPAPVGSTLHDIEIAERGYENFYDGNGEPDVEIVDVPFARVRTVHVAARDKLHAVRREDIFGSRPDPYLHYGHLYIPPDLFDALPDVEVYFVLDGIEAL